MFIASTMQHIFSTKSQTVNTATAEFSHSFPIIVVTIQRFWAMRLAQRWRHFPRKHFVPVIIIIIVEIFQFFLVVQCFNVKRSMFEMHTVTWPGFHGQKTRQT